MPRKNNTRRTAAGIIPHREESRRTGGSLRDEVDAVAAAVTMKQPTAAERKQNRERVAKPLMEILNNPETPEDLEEKITDWLCEAANQDPLMLLMDDLAHNSFDNSQIESLANTVKTRCYAFTMDSDEHEAAYIERARKQWEAETYQRMKQVVEAKIVAT